ncbi:response regulator [Alteromonas sp. CYL-A6]|uniref:response regulator n=1 Tax=Alteromonas nitratireducens TaxID=3390813 RepID=UPI0034BCF344
MSITARYIIALLLIACLVTASALSMKYIFTVQNNDAEIINRAGQQRMLSQRIYLYATKISACSDRNASEEQKLESALSQFSDNHLFLTQLPELSPQIASVFFGEAALDTSVKSYIKSGRDILNSKSCGALPSAFTSDKSDDLLGKLDAVVTLFANEARQHVRNVETLETYLWIATLLLLLVEALYIFRPMERQIISTIAKLKDSTKAAEAANKAKSEFLASMSHELRTPMNGMFGMIELAMDNPDRSSQYLKKSQAAGRQLLNLINDILDLSKIEAGKLKIINESFNLLELLDDIVNIYSIGCQRKGLKFQYQKTEQLPPNIIGDSNRIAQVLHNLLSNALKFTEVGIITFEIELEKKSGLYWLKFVVTDTGIGIREEKVDNIFNKFEQADQSTTRIYGGTGLGLSIAKQLTELMGGELSVCSNHYSGSAFTFSVPVKIHYKKHEDFLPATTLHCAIVDDLQTSREYLNHVVTGMGVRVKEFDSAEAYLKSKDVFDLALIDLSMPDVDGVQLLQRLLNRESSRIPYIIVISAVLEHLRAEKEIYDMIWRSHAKPISRSELESDILELQNTISTVEKTELTSAVNKVSILVAEDNDINAEVIKHMLSSEGYDVVIASDGQKAVDALTVDHFDLVLMDLQMPVMDGIEATQKIRQQLVMNTPIIALTANAYAEDRDNCLAAGMNDFLTKPVTKEKLLRMIRRFVYVESN